MPRNAALAGMKRTSHEISPSDSRTSSGEPRTKRRNKDSPSINKRDSKVSTVDKDETRATALQQTESSTSQNEPGSSTESKLRLTYETGDLFVTPPNTLLIHACNCEGSWGAGIAKVFRFHFPSAFEKYAQYCASASSAHALVGTALLIPPRQTIELGHNPAAESQPSSPTKPKSRSKRQAEDCFVGCLFTSRSKGRKRDSKAQILAATDTAMRDLLRVAEDWNSQHETSIAKVRMCKINSGLFGVPWEETGALLENIETKEFTNVEVVSMPGK